MAKPRENPATLGVAVVPNDATAVNFRSLYVGGAGNLSVVMVDDAVPTPVVFAAVPAGTVLPIAVRIVRTTGTTATNIVGLS